MPLPAGDPEVFCTKVTWPTGGCGEPSGKPADAASAEVESSAQRAAERMKRAKVARMTPARVEKLLTDPGIVRNRAKVESTVSNAKAFLKIQKEFGSFNKYVWQFVGGKTINNTVKRREDLAAESDESRALSKDLQKRGFRFVGPTIMYAFMQATGLVNDHIVGCPEYARSAR